MGGSLEGTPYMGGRLSTFSRFRLRGSSCKDSSPSPQRRTFLGSLLEQVTKGPPGASGNYAHWRTSAYRGRRGRRNSAGKDNIFFTIFFRNVSVCIFHDDIITFLLFFGRRSFIDTLEISRFSRSCDDAKATRVVACANYRRWMQ